MAASLGRLARRRTLKIAKRVDALIEGCDDPFVRAVVDLCGGIRAGCLGEWSSAFQKSHDAEQGFTELGRSAAIRESSESHLIIGSLSISYFWQLFASTWTGELNQLRDRCDHLIEEAIHRHDQFTSVMLGGIAGVIRGSRRTRPRRGFGN